MACFMMYSNKNHVREEESMMHTWSKRLLVLVMAVILICTSTGFSAFAQGPKVQDVASGESMIADFVLLRPLGIVATAVGAAFYVVSLPFSLPTGSAGTAWEKLVVEPASFTFTRPLGQVD